jgi:CRP/FNR family transcriptional regulator, cyclic AMP receptor protein
LWNQVEQLPIKQNASLFEREVMYQQADLSKMLRRIPWFVELEQSQLDRLATIATLYQYEAGDFVFKEGDREDCLYVLLEGQVVLEVEVPTRGQIQFYTAEILDVIGWSSMTPIVRQRTASARAVCPSALIGFNNKLLEQMCDEDHELGYIIMRRLANVVANRLLTARLCLLDIIAHTAPQEVE